MIDRESIDLFMERQEFARNHFFQKRVYYGPATLTPRVSMQPASIKR